MKGHIRLHKDKDGKVVPGVFRLVVPIGKYPSGKAKYKWYTFHGSKRDAETYLASLVQQVSAVTFVEPTKMTVEEFLRLWLEKSQERKKNPLAEKSLEWYKSNIDNYIVPSLGKMQLVKLRPLHIQAMIDSIDSDAVASGVFRTFRAALNKAVEWWYIAKEDNPIGGVSSPIHVAEEYRVMTPDQIDNFFTAAKKTCRHYSEYAACVMALTTAMRLREICGLRWSNVDLDHGLIFVQQQLRKAGSETSFKKLKTKKSARMIPMADILKTELEIVKTLQDEDKERCGEYYEDHDLVLTVPGGRPLDPHNLTSRSYRKSLEAAGIPYVKFHMLRHSAATLLKSLGVDTRIIADICGHAEESTTDRIYTHSEQNIEPKRKAIQKLNKALTKQSVKHKKGQAL